MLTRITITAIASIVFLFLFWKKLKEDYAANQIFTTAFYALLGIAMASIISDNYSPFWWFWLSLIGALLGIFVGISRFKLRVLETINAFVFSSLVLLEGVFIYHLIREKNTQNLLASTFVFLMFLLFLLFDAHYKKFSWYKSGRVGFSALSVAGIFFLTRGIIATLFPNMISLVGPVELIISAIVAFVCFFGVYNLATLET